MIQKLKNAAISLAAMATLLVPSLVVATPAFAASDIQNSLCAGTNLDLSGTKDNCGTGSGATSNLNKLLTDIVNIFSAIVGVIAVIMIIVGGLRYITSGGDSSKVGAAKNTLIYAIIGLIVVALAQIIVHFVFAKATSI